MGAKKTSPKPQTELESLEATPKVTGRRWPRYLALAVSLAVLTACAVVASSGMSEMEKFAFDVVNGVDLPSWVASQVASPLSDAVWGMVILVAIMLVVPRFRWRAWQYLAAGGSAYAVGTIIEQLVQRARPSGLYVDVMERAVQGGLGFPSTHVAVVTALGLTIWPYVAWPWRIVILVLIGAVAWSRMFLGVHAPLDIVGGVAVGTTVVFVTHLLPKRIRHFFRLGHHHD